MIEKEICISTKHGDMPCFYAHPEGVGPWPGIILFMDAPGIREELRNHARRIAKHGYVCLLPDMYYRVGTVRFDLKRRNAAMSRVVAAARRSIDDELVNEDTASMLEFFDTQDAVRPGPVGTVGHCAGGRYMVTTAARFPDRIVAGASLYGVELVTDLADSPHRNLAAVRAELYFGFGVEDRATPPEYRAELNRALNAAGLHYKLDAFANAGHGYMFVERFFEDPASLNVYAHLAAEETWRNLVALWDRRLKGC